MSLILINLIMIPLYQFCKIQYNNVAFTLQAHFHYLMMMIHSFTEKLIVFPELIFAVIFKANSFLLFKLLVLYEGDSMTMIYCFKRLWCFFSWICVNNGVSEQLTPTIVLADLQNMVFIRLRILDFQMINCFQILFFTFRPSDVPVRAI